MIIHKLLTGYTPVLHKVCIYLLMCLLENSQNLRGVLLLSNRVLLHWGVILKRGGGKNVYFFPRERICSRYYHETLKMEK